MQTGRGAAVGDRTGLARPWLIAIAVAVAGFDQLTKLAIVSSFTEGESRGLVDDVLRLSHIRNSGAAFGMLRGFGGVLALAALVGIIGFFALLVRRPAPLVGIGASLVAGGALGNLIDRVFRGPLGRGTVVDFVDFKFWPAFNLADSAITIGALLLVWAGLKQRPGGEPA